ncbi:site-specific integrase [Dorea formicigenerans]|uniref:Site-specific integrase n=2 Tax=Lachnospiraceae TaxID=186803 RepID=A0A848CRD0_9FIRM|nr:site-specific integrase [Dorea formicigenerans]NME58378.1 site-specific integrase [Dorea formicigenerans]
MPVYKNEKNGTWYAMVRYKDWTGQNKQKCQRGFATRREALEWEAQFKLQKTADIDMTLEAFYELYEQDVRPRLKENTWLTKQVIIEKKILPYLGKRKLSEITAKDVIDWQNEMMKLKKPNGEPLSQCYLKTIHAELSALFNHAAKYYQLNINPARNAGCMGQEENKEMSFWTKEEYLKFAEAIMDRPISYYAFEILYWCGIREGELLALTPADFDFDKAVLRINKSYQRIHGEDVVTTPKTKKSNRMIKMPKFLCEEMKDMMEMVCETDSLDRDLQDSITELNIISEQMQIAIAENSRVALDQDEYEKRYAELTARYEKSKAKYDDIAEQIESKKAKRELFKGFIRTLEKQDGLTCEFDAGIWSSLVQEVVVKAKDDIRFIFKNGFEVRV